MNILGRFLLLLALVVLAVPVEAGEHEGGKGRDNLAKTTTNDVNDFISINNILMWISNNGMTSHNPQTDGSGLEWPKGTAMYAIYEDGLVWGGLLQGVKHVGGSTYRYGLQAGKIKADGTADNPADPRFTIYKVRKVTRDGYARLTTAEQDRLKKDFENWPYADGAPINDANNDGQYNPNFEAWLDGDDVDSPWFIGDEVLWFVSNDLDPERTNRVYGSPPIGLEVQTLVWGYNQTGPLGNMVFTKYTVINRGSEELTDAYFAKWSDPDLGDAGDDFVGIDTTLALGYVYNGLARDDIYGVPPAAGYDFFQGPIVPGDPEDEAFYDFGVLKGWKNLQISGFAFYINSDPIYQDPDLGVSEGTEQMYNYLTSRLYDGSPFIDPLTDEEVKIALAGDPVTKTGWIDGIVNAPDDRRMMMVTGPFVLHTEQDLANGKVNKQEVVVASIVGRGSDRISSLQVLRFYDRFAQQAFDNNFILPQAPPDPKVVSTMQNRKVILSWGGEDAPKTEDFIDQGYAFEGYNIYQFPFATSTLADAKRVATFDKVNNITTIFDEVIDPNSGAVVILPTQFGTDSGIKRYIEIQNDAITDRPLVNNQPYYFAITTYSYNPDDEATPRQLESTPIVFEVRPRFMDPGNVVYTEPGEMLDVIHTRGSSTGQVLVEVFDPEKVTGHDYEVTFSSLGPVEVPYAGYDTVLIFNDHGWNLKNVTRNDILVEKETSFGGLNTDFFTFDGLKIGVAGSGKPTPGQEILDIVWEGGPEVYEAYAGYWILGPDFFGSSLYPWEIQKVVELRFNRSSTQNGYIYRRGDPEANYKYQGYFPSKFEVWDVTDADEANHKQIEFAVVEAFDSPANDNQWAPTYSPGDREYLFLIDRNYDGNPNPDWTGDFTILAGAGEMPILYAAWTIKMEDAPAEVLPWQDGDVWRWIANIPFSTEDVFTFMAPKPMEFNKTVAQRDVNKIQVFPNPYAGSNAQELNKYQRFVTFNHLPQRAIFRVYTVSGALVASFEKNDASQLATWDLQNDNGLPVASGMYIIHIDMPDLGVEKVLKLGVVTEAQYLDRI